MGFSLKLFFEELRSLLNSPDYRDDEERIAAAKQYVETERKYAEECGQLR